MTIRKSISAFFRDDVRNYSIYACERQIPSGVDGLKPSQRKVLFGMQKKFPNQEVKVSIASAGIMEVSCYHHGSLDGVIVNMAQNFPGSNNVPLLEPIGQFGSRIGPESAASRYIFTKLSAACKKLFNPIDENILNWLDDDGTSIEPEFYLPIIPTVLVNGVEGMGTGYATSIMAYNPTELKEWIVNHLKGKRTKDTLIPWYKGFTGTIMRIAGQVVVFGRIEVTSSTSLRITELPIGSYTSKYREVLNKLEDDGVIKSYTDDSDDSKTEFNIRCTRELTQESQSELLSMFKLISKSTENVTVWDETGKIRRFDSVVDLLRWFTEYRVSRYEDRRQYQISALTQTLHDMSERIRFIRLYLKESSKWAKLTNNDVISILNEHKFASPSDLLAIRVARLTGEEIGKLEQQIEVTKLELEAMKATTAVEMYIKELTDVGSF